MLVFPVAVRPSIELLTFANVLVSARLSVAVVENDVSPARSVVLLS
jgi:hypothetical protein